MKMSELKAAIAAKAGITLPTLMMVRQFALNTDGTTDMTKPTEWVSHWDNENRVRITMHQDVMNTVKATPDFSGLSFKYEELPELGTPGQDGYRAPYKRFVVITPAHVEATF
jgi:hypothetical protein